MEGLRVDVRNEGEYVRMGGNADGAPVEPCDGTTYGDGGGVSGTAVGKRD
jgi:hypothetical protein